MSRQKSETISPFFEDQPVQLPPGSVPDTITFKCPGSMSNKCNDEKNNNVPPEQPIREMPKTTKCPPDPSKTVDPIEEPKKKPEDSPPPPPPTSKCSSVPETQTFKCTEPEPEKKDEGSGGGNKAEVKTDEPAIKLCSSAGAAVPSKRNCKCGTPIAPVPKVSACGCKGKRGTNCGANTSCDVVPLTMKKTN